MEAEKVDILDVLIIGAGLSGLTAAYEILKIDPKLSVQVLEAKSKSAGNSRRWQINWNLQMVDRVGGRTMTVDVDIGEGRKEKFDLGGQWVTPYTSDIPSMGSLWGPIELQLFIWKVNDGWIPSKISDLKICSIFFLVGWNRSIGFVNKSPWRIRIYGQRPLSTMPWPWKLLSGRIWKAKGLSTPFRPPVEWPSVSVKYSSTFGFIIILFVWHPIKKGADLERVSALFFLAYAAAAGGVMRLLLATENGAQELRVKVILLHSKHEFI